MTDFVCAPVLMMGFNRPELTRGLLDRVRKARPARLFFAVDGARENRDGERETVAAVRAIAQEVDWPCEVKTLFQPRNLGCAQAIPSAISWALSQVPYCIILEDDCWPSKGFFRYETELLERYKDDERVGMVSGFNHYGFQTNPKASYHFTTIVDIWGWGTWARVWKDYTADISHYADRLEAIVDGMTRNRRRRKLSLRMIRDVLQKPTTWDVQFAVLIMDRRYLCAAPRKRMVSNRGLGDARGVHTIGYDYDSGRYCDVWAGERPIVHTPVELDWRAVDLSERRACGLLPRALTVFGNKCRWLRPVLDGVCPVVEKLCPALFRI